MKLTKKWLKKHSVSKDFYNWYKEQGTTDIDELFDLAIKAERYSDIIWVITEKLNKKDNKKFVIHSAESVLPIFENRLPNDERPRKAIKTVKKYLENPTKKNRNKLNDASAAIHSILIVALGTDLAVYNGAVYNAATAVSNTITAIYNAAYVSRDVAGAVHRAICAGDYELKVKILKYGLELVKGEITTR